MYEIELSIIGLVIAAIIVICAAIIVTNRPESTKVISREK